MDQVAEPYIQKIHDACRLIGQAVEPWALRAETFLAKHRRTAAIAISLGLHVLVVAFLMIGLASTASGGGSGGPSYGSGRGAGLGVELVSVAGTTPKALSVKTPEPDDQVDAVQPTRPDVSAAITDTASLITLDTQAGVGVKDEDAETNGAKSATPESEASAGGVGQGGQTSGVNDALWKQIEPCWRRLADQKTGNATLKIDFSPLGNVARTLAVDSEQSSDLKSQAVAAEAVAQCGPYVSAGSRENVVIAFPALR